MHDRMKIYRFMLRFCRDVGRCPTVREIGEAMLIPSTSVVTYHLKKLVDEKLIDHGDDGRYIPVAVKDWMAEMPIPADARVLSL